MSKDTTDPSLSQGWGYFVEETVYKAYLEQRAGEVQEVRNSKSAKLLLICPKKSTCSSHSAVNMANTKANTGLAATGVGTIDCACHNMKLPTGVGDLQKGERYV